MATLLLDMGNSRCKWALTLDGEQILSTGLWNNQKFDEAVWVKKLSEFSKFPIRKIKISSVFKAPRKALISQWCEQVFAVKPEFASSQIAHLTHQGRLLANAYQVPEALGVDRWLAMIAACRHTKGAFVVIDAGTAITLDMVDKKGQHQGGHIVPGSRLMQRALLGQTGGIKHSVEISQAGNGSAVESDGQFDVLLGTDTGYGVKYGCDLASSAYVITVVNTLFAQGKIDKAFFCGGDGADLCEKLLQDNKSLQRSQCHFVEQLVIEGLMNYKSA